VFCDLFLALPILRRKNQPIQKKDDKIINKKDTWLKRKLLVNFEKLVFCLPAGRQPSAFNTNINKNQNEGLEKCYTFLLFTRKI
jgi:hypothetical protein